MVPLRDRLYLDHTIVMIGGPLTERAISGAPDALCRLATSPGWEWLARSFPRRGPRPILSADALDEDASDGALVLAISRLGLRGAAARIGVAGDRVVLLVSHGAADGTEAVALFGAIVTVASGEPAPVVPPPVRWALAKASWTVGPLAFGRWLRSRQSLSGTTEEVVGRVPSSSRFGSLALDAADLARLRSLPSGSGRATTATRLITAVLAGLRDVDERHLNPMVLIPMDLRPFAPGRVRGNFFTIEPHGGLRSADWSSAAISARIADRRKRGIPALVVAVLRHHRPRLRQRRPGTSAVSVSVVPEPVTPSSAWVTGGPGVLRCASPGPSPSAGTFVFVTVGRDRAGISVWDDSGAFDTVRVAAVVLAGIRGSAGGRQTPALPPLSAGPSP